MGRNKKLRTMQRTVVAIARQELGSFMAMQQKKKFDELLRRGIIVVDKNCEEWIFDDFNWIVT